MSFIKALDISASGLYAQKKRMEIVAQNIANADTILTDSEEPYRRKVAILSENNEKRNFSSVIEKVSLSDEGNGVRVSSIEADQEPFKLVYDPEHPLASEDGYVKMPNIDTTVEMLELLSATRAYEANITVLNATKSMFSKALTIGK